MSYREADIMFQTEAQGPTYFWVLRQPKAYTVLRAGITHSITLQSYPRHEDGLSLAIAYAQYLFSRVTSPSRTQPHQSS
jgi:hypothetical protein